MTTTYGIPMTNKFPWTTKKQAYDASAVEAGEFTGLSELNKKENSVEQVLLIKDPEGRIIKMTPHEAQTFFDLQKVADQIKGFNERVFIKNIKEVEGIGFLAEAISYRSVHKFPLSATYQDIHELSSKRPV